MASQRKSFNVAGPSHLTHVDWSNFSHRRSVAASLVKGVYIHEQDRQQCCHGGDGGGAVATSRWWESFGFQLKQELVDEKDKSIFGAVYELKSSSCQAQAQAQTQAYKPPKLVIAFRGTLIKKKSLVQDFRLDHRIIQRTLHKSDRVRDGLQAVHTAVSKVGAENVWLAGHSLGSSIALLVGRNMVKMGYCLETYLFNPPFVSVPTQIIKNPKLQEGIRLAHTAVKAGMAVAMSIVNKKIVEDNNEEFSLLSPWIPYLFINPSDPICAEYLEYFQHRERMVAAAGEIGRLAAQNSVRCMVANAMGKDCKPSHLIPSAYLTINLNGSPVSEWEAHKLSQWWHPDLKLDHKLYQL